MDRRLNELKQSEQTVFVWKTVTYAVTIALKREARECRYVNWIERRKEEWRRSEEPLYNSEMTQLKS